MNWNSALKAKTLKRNVKSVVKLRRTPLSKQYSRRKFMARAAKIEGKKCKIGDFHLRGQKRTFAMILALILLVIARYLNILGLAMFQVSSKAVKPLKRE